MTDGPLAVVLAAGRGTRMRSHAPKVLHPVAGRPLLLHAIDAVQAAIDVRPVVIIAPDTPEIAEAVAAVADVAVQAQPRGTGDALRSVPPDRRTSGTVVVIGADTPLVEPESIRRLVQRRESTGAACALLVVTPEDPTGLGRVLRDAGGRVTAVVEERDLSPGEPRSAECNAGVYAFDGSRLWDALESLRDDNAQGELYLTDAVTLLGGAEAVDGGADEGRGVNDRRQLAGVEAILRRRTLDALMLSGVTVEDPQTTYVDVGVSVGSDTVLRPMTVLRGSTVLGEGCVVGPMAQLHDVRAGDRVRIGASYLEDCELGDDVVIGQYDRLRPGTVLEQGVYIGTHAEVKNSRVGRGSRVSHFSCVLDSDVGAGVNVSAGTVTCNYDGMHKSRTVIEDGVFVGSDAMLVAPLRIGEGAYVAAGSVISRDVPAGALAVERAEQRIVEGWARRRRAGAAEAG